jgi:hypothetical protein
MLFAIYSHNLIRYVRKGSVTILDHRVGQVNLWCLCGLVHIHHNH